MLASANNFSIVGVNGPQQFSRNTLVHYIRRRHHQHNFAAYQLHRFIQLPRQIISVTVDTIAIQLRQLSDGGHAALR